MKFKWTIEVEMDEAWVADGFDMTDERVSNMLQAYMPHVYGHEVGGRVLKRPPDEAVAKAQGYKTVEAYLKARGK